MDSQLLQNQQQFIILFAIAGIIFLVAMQYIYSSRQRGNPLAKPKNHIWIFVAMAAFAFLIRLIIAYQMPGYESDVNCFRAWAMYSYEGGFENFYNGDFFADYPPLYIYLLSFLGLIRDGAGMDSMSAEYGVLVKLPALLLDILFAYFVYKVAEKAINSKAGLFLSALILLNPAVMANSALWGQVDIIVTVLMVLTLFLLYKNKLFLSAVVFILAFLLKPQAIMIAPVLLFVFVRNIVVSKNKGKAVLTLVGALAVMVALFFVVPLPFGINREPLWLVDRMMETMGQYQYATLNAMNVYALAGLNFTPIEGLTVLGLPLNVWGYICVGIICVYALWLYVKNPDKRYIFILAAFIVYSVFQFVHSMHERYIYVVPVLLLMAYIFIRDKRLLYCTLLVFGISMLNQCISLYHYQMSIPYAACAVLSATGLAVYAYTAYVCTALALRPPVVDEPFFGENIRIKESKPPKPQKQMQIAAGRKTMERKDVLVMAVITAVYSVVAFTNLGSFTIPSSTAILNGEVVVELEEPETVASMKYYADYGTGVFTVSSSVDGQYYTPVVVYDGNEAKNEVIHEAGDLFKWNEYNLGVAAKYLKITPYDSALPIREMGFESVEGELLTPVGVSGTAENAQALFDEQGQVPRVRSYMTDFYFDELYHVRTAYENINGITPYEITHPPLGKVIIASGIELFGMNPFGWRFMGTLAGVLMLPVIYIIAKMLFKKTRFAAVATILLAVDFMHFAQTRIGTVDSYSILWIMLMYLFMYRYTQTSFNKQPLGKTLVPLFFCGLFFGLGAATKWLCIYAGAGLLVIFLITMFKRYQEYKAAVMAPDGGEVANSYRKNVILTLLACVGFFIAIPAAIYLVSYAPYFMVTDGGAYRGLSDIIDNQKYMLNYHAFLNPDTVHPFSSQWYTWPADIRPVLFFSESDAQAGTVSTLSTMGNPLLWWAGIVAAVVLAVKVVLDSRYRKFGLVFIVIATLSQYMPWWFVTRELYIYHYFATVPFLILLVVYWLSFIEKDYKYGKIFTLGFVMACVIFFIVFYPVISGVPVDARYAEGLRWLGTWPFY